MDAGGLEPEFVAGCSRLDPIGSRKRPRGSSAATANGPVPSPVSWASGWTGPIFRRLSEPSWKSSSAGSPSGRRSRSSWPRGCATHRPPAARRSSLQAMAWSGLNEKQVPAAGSSALASALDGRPSNAELVPLPWRPPAPCRSRATAAGELSPGCFEIAAMRRNPDELRLSALAAVPGGLGQPDREPLFVPARQADRAPDRRQPHHRGRRPGAGEAHRANNSTRLAETLRSAGPVEVDRLLAAFEQSSDETLGLSCRRALGESPASPSLRPNAVKAHLAKYRPAVQKQAQALLAKINVDAAKQKAQLEQLLPTLAAGDIRRGQLVFHSEKAACYSCHAIGYRGGNVGPDLTRIGSIRADRDLLEAIVFPSASLVRSFEPIAVATSDGKVL